MVFDWFRRKFDKSESESVPDTEQVEESAGEEEELVASEEEEKSQTVSEEVATDYLAWAKAAYQNIQQQQESASLVEPEPELITVETSDAPVDELKIETDSPDIEPDLEAADSETDVTVDEPEDTPASEESIPIWARDDRQQRLEQLKATAIEPEAPEAPAADVELDDDFLWSAKVLADRGRTPEQVSLDEINWLKKLRQGLDKTRRGFVNQLKALIGQGPLNANAVESIETLLLQADVGVEATDYVIETLQAKLRQESLPPDEAVAYLKQILRDLLDKPFQENYSSEFLPTQNELNIWLLVGVNGVGKTTTIGKLAHMTKSSGYQCLIAAGDTFRAAAVEQVKVWGERSGIEVIANPGQNTDPAAVVFDAISAAQARGTELLLVDTAGRLQNKKNLMDELSKIRRIIDKQANGAQVESLLVLDATLGQNGLRQAQVFAEAAKLSGVVLTKLDGTAKGGVALAVVQQLGLPIRFVGAGEGIEDLRPFSSYEFVEALLSG
ncbi:signal recognition particle-docking protein FtsY [Chamaesiphon sp. VAR_48_metabat_135_sub]|uniref:signal recognition particle-docking protein FtsY n=1 Tax=Chamaesiphon sp. VAR_48_metabat_135_sub TaxID=2964699 RepID=UPI00286AE15E|nr:signal recognition particle-docking protein FtsY [Chamaesiphon sp. VAR_48_metabat_135_sub]